MNRSFLLLVCLLVVMVTVVAGCAKPPLLGLKSPTELSKSDIQKVVEIALLTPEVQEELKKEPVYKADLQWVAIVWRGSEASELRYFEFNNVQNNPNYQLVSELAQWYPGVVIHFGEPSKWVIQVAVSLEAGKAVNVLSSPDLSSPGRFPPKSQ